MKNILTILFFVSVIPSSINAQTITTTAGNGAGSSTGDGGMATAASFNQPGGAFYDATGSLYVVEYTGNKIRKIDGSGIVSAFAGNGIYGFGGDGGPATAASFRYPIDLADDVFGNVYIVDNTNHRIRKVNSSGIITTFAGSGAIGYTGDGGPATAATLNNPSRLTIDALGNVYFADAGNNAVRKVNTSGIITTIAGTGVAGFSGDGGPATAAKLNQPLGVAFDGNGNMYIADAFNRRIRKVSPSGIISTIAGTGVSAATGDGGPAIAATMQYPNGIAVDLTCNVYFSDWSTQKIRKINTSGIITTVVGTGIAGFSGDGGAAVAAKINGPNNLTFDNAMNLYIPDFYNNRIRKVANLGDFTGCPPLSPVASYTATGTTVCQDSCITFSSTSTGAIDSIKWTTSPSGAIITGAATNPANICFLSSGTTTVKLKVYGNGTVDSSTSVITVTPAPRPTITKTGYTFSVTGGPYLGYQWFNGAAIPGATSATYTYTVGANYWVVVDSGGCLGKSNAINTTGVLILDPTETTFRLAQNHSHSFTIYSSNALTEPLSVSVTDMLGRELVETNWSKGANSLIFNTLSFHSGLYLIRISNQNTFVTLKWMQQ